MNREMKAGRSIGRLPDSNGKGQRKIKKTDENKGQLNYWSRIENRETLAVGLLPSKYEP